MKLSLAHLKGQINWQDTFAALNHRNFRLWFLGQLVSLVGTWMQNTAQGYLVYQITGSAAYLGYVGFASGLPTLIFTLYGGVVADRLPRRTLIIITQTAMMILAFLLAGLVFLGLVQPWHIIVLAFLLGIANAFDAPARQAFVVELIDNREDMANAIALNSTMFNMATVVGPAVAGVAYALFGPAWCFTINGISYIAVIIALALMQIQPIRNKIQRVSALSQLKESFHYVTTHVVTRVLIINIGIISLFGLSMNILFPAWAVDILGGDVTTNGLLLSARGAGALLGALVVASVSRLKVKGKLWTIGSILMPIMMVIFALVHWLPLSLLVLVGVGWAFMIQSNTSNALVQMEVPDELRGRVMSIYTLTFFGGLPLGSLIIGYLATYLSEPVAILLNAIVLLIFGAVVWWRLPFLRKLE